MDFSPFFNYPDQDSNSATDELIFLPAWLDRDWTKLLEQTQTQVFAPGAIVIKAGDTERALYLVAYGTFEVLLTRPNSKRLFRFGTVDAGSVIGEQSFLDGKPRSATIRAITDGQMFQLSYEVFELFAAREPKLARDILFDLGRILSIRLRQTTAFIANWAA